MEIKVRLSLLIQGAKPISHEECKRNPKKNYKNESLVLNYKDGNKTYKETIVIKTRKPQLIKQVIKISKESYDYMVNPDVPPINKLAKKIYLKKGNKDKEETTVWAKYTPNERLDWHLSQIADLLGAKGYSFEVLDD